MFLQLPHDSLNIILSYLPSIKSIFHDFALVNRECYQVTRSCQFWNYIDGDLRFRVNTKTYMMGYKGINSQWLYSVLKYQEMSQLVLSNTPIKAHWPMQSEEDKALIEQNCHHIQVKNLFNFHSAHPSETSTSVVALFVNSAANLESLHIQNVEELNGLNQELLFYRLSSNETRLHRLVLRQVKDMNIKSLYNSLKTNVTVRSLDLSGNELGVKGGRYIGELLKENSTITDLNLFGCFIEVQGVMALSQILADENRSLTCLDLGMNRIRNTGMISLIKCISRRKDCTLKTLKLTFNMISDRGIQSVQKDLRLLSLDLLDLSCNFLSHVKCIELSTSNEKDHSAGHNTQILLNDMTQNFKKKSIKERTIYFSPIDSSTNEAQIREFFLSKIGVKVGKITLKEHKIKYPRFHGYALVECTDKLDAQKCVDYRTNHKMVFFQSHDMTIAIEGFFRSVISSRRVYNRHRIFY